MIRSDFHSSTPPKHSYAVHMHADRACWRVLTRYGTFRSLLLLPERLPEPWNVAFWWINRSGGWFVRIFTALPHNYAPWACMRAGCTPKCAVYHINSWVWLSEWPNLVCREWQKMEFGCGVSPTPIKWKMLNFPGVVSVLPWQSTPHMVPDASCVWTGRKCS